MFLRGVFEQVLKEIPVNGNLTTEKKT